VADVAVGDRDELDFMPLRRPLGRHAGRLELGIVRMRAEANDPQLAVGFVGQREVPRGNRPAEKNGESGHKTAKRQRAHGDAPRCRA
jgi:hypothetical protein